MNIRFDLVKGFIAVARSAIYKKDIPKKYSNLPVMGKGMTSLILDAGDDVIVVTRDQIKKYWLTDPYGLEMGDDLDEYEVANHQVSRINGYPVFIIKMPKLKKLSRANKAKVKRERDAFNEIWNKFETEFKHKARIDKRYNKAFMYNDIVRAVEGYLIDEDPDNMFLPVLNFASSYENWILDIHNGNFAEDADGKIVLLDPLASGTLLRDLKLGSKDFPMSYYM